MHIKPSPSNSNLQYLWSSLNMSLPERLRVCDLRGLGREREEVGEEENTISSGGREGYHHHRLLQGVERTRGEVRGCWWLERELTLTQFRLCVAMTEVYMCSVRKSVVISYIFLHCRYSSVVKMQMGIYLPSLLC